MPDKKKVFEIIQYAFARELGWRKPEISTPIGPQFPAAFEEFEANRALKIAESEYLISEHMDLDLDTVIEYVRETDPLKKRRMPKPRGAFKAVVSLARHTELPRWFEGGFGNPEKKPHYKYWSSLQDLNLEEAVCLSLNCDPSLYDDLERINQSLENGDETNEPLVLIFEFFRERRKLIWRRFNPQNLSDLRINSKDFVDWVQQVEMEVDPGLLEMFSSEESDPLKLQPSNFDPREKTSLLQIIALMSKDGYRYNEVGRSTLPTELYDAAQLNDVPITKETIRKHLKSAAEVLKGPWKVE